MMSSKTIFLNSLYLICIYSFILIICECGTSAPQIKYLTRSLMYTDKFTNVK